MKKRILILVLATICPLLALARFMRVLDMKDLISEAQLVFLGKAISVEPSGITTSMSYPTWRGVTFEWLKVEVEVTEPVKGVVKGERVWTLMLGTRGKGAMFNAPGMVEPEQGKAYFLCLLPTTISNVYASLTAPWDDDEGIFLLDRQSMSPARATFYKDGKQVAYHEQSEKNAVLWKLVDDEGRLQPGVVAEMRKTYAKEIRQAPATNAVIHLQWETQKSTSGWERDVPKGTAKEKQPGGPGGPVTFTPKPGK